MRHSPVFLSLGANLGHPFEQLCQALTWLESSEKIELKKISSIYRTEPLYLADQPDFLNLVCEIETDFSPEELLAYCQKIEHKIGRQPSRLRNAPRLIDIDIIYFADLIIEKDDLTIPHPRLAERQFVLRPLAEIAPRFICPRTGKSVSTLLKIVPDQSRIAQTELIPSFHQIDGVL